VNIVSSTTAARQHAWRSQQPQHQTSYKTATAHPSRSGQLLATDACGYVVRRRCAHPTSVAHAPVLVLVLAWVVSLLAHPSSRQLSTGRHMVQHMQKRLREAAAASRSVRLHTSHSCSTVPSSLQERYNRGFSCVQLYSPCEIDRNQCSSNNWRPSKLFTLVSGVFLQHTSSCVGTGFVK
jgi:hypothetical protein